MHLQPLHSREFAGVVRDEHATIGERVPGDKGVGLPDGAALSEQLALHGGGFFDCVGIQRDDVVQARDKLLNFRRQLPGRLGARYTVQQFKVGDGGDDDAVSLLKGALIRPARRQRKTWTSLIGTPRLDFVLEREPLFDEDRLTRDFP